MDRAGFCNKDVSMAYSTAEAEFDVLLMKVDMMCCPRQGCLYDQQQDGWQSSKKAGGEEKQRPWDAQRDSGPVHPSRRTGHWHSGTS